MTVAATIVATATISGNGGASPSVSGTWPPSGAAVGDIALAFGRDYNVSTTVTTPTTGGTAWTIKDSTYSYQRIYAHTIASGESAPSLGTTNAAEWMIIILHWPSATAPAIGSLFDAAVNWDSAGPATNIAFNSLATPSQANCLPLVYGAMSGTSTSAAAPSQYSTLVKQDSVNVGGHPITAIVANAAAQSSPASIAAGSCTVSGGGSSNYTIAGVFAITPGTPISSGNPTITSTSTTTPAPGQTSITITGTNFTGSGDTVQLIDGSNTTQQTVTADGVTSITYTCVQGNCRYGAVQLQVTTQAGLTVQTPVTLTPASGVQDVNIGVLRLLTQATNPAGPTTPSRLYDTPTDLTSNNAQVELALGSGSNGTYGINLDADGRLWVDIAVKQVNWRWITNDGLGTWSSLYNWATVGLFPSFLGPNLVNQNGSTGSAYSLALGGLFQSNDSTETPLVYSVSVGSLTGSGLSINSSTGTISGATPVAGTYTITVRATDADGQYAETNSFSIIIAAAGGSVAFAGTIPNQPNAQVGTAFSLATASFFTNATSYAVNGTLPGGLSIASGTGIISGTPNGTGINTGSSANYTVSVTASNGVPSSATSNNFTITVFNPASTTTVPAIAPGPVTQASASSTLSGANLTGSFPVTWAGSQNVYQSIPAGTVVATGTTVIVAPVVIFTGSIPSQGPYTAGVPITPINIASFFTFAQNYALDPTSSPLPPGLTLDTAAGTISGTPTGGGIAPGSSLAYTNIIVQGNTIGGNNTNSNAFQITISVSLATVAVPDVSSTHPTAASAAATIVAANLVPAQVNQGSSTIAAGHVISQSPAAGTIVNTGSTVTVYVSIQNNTAPVDALYPNNILGLTFDVVRTPKWNTASQVALSGKRSVTPLQPYPIISFELNYSLLRDDLTISDLRALVGLFNATQGRFASFLFTDPDFNTILASAPQQFATSDGTTTTQYPITANYENVTGPGYVEQIQNFNGTPVLYDNNAGTIISASNYTLGPTGLVQFSTPTTSGHALLWSGSWYYRCRFDKDSYDWTKFMNNFWEAKKISFTSLFLS
jgi:hypothetical protein